MRLKTFVSTYLLILVVLFSSIGIVSFYLNNSQVSMLKETSTGQFQTIISSLSRDMSVLWEREEWLSEARFSDAVGTLVRGYTMYYGRHNINITVTDLRLSGRDYPPSLSEVAFVSNNAGHFITISGLLPGRFDHFLLDYSMNVTENITNMRNIQSTLLISAIVFSIIAAIALYFILSSIFKPLTVVARASREIASGRFGERIPVKSKNEVAQVAIDFNKMAEQIEQQISLLEGEAANKQQFVDNFAHEMRTPLTSIYGYAEYMQKARLDEGEIIELSERIMARTSYLKEIANSLLKLAMLRDYSPDKNKISVRHLFDDIAQTVKVPVEEANIKFICSSSAELMEGQEDLIKSLLLNLCLNALKSCTPNEGVIHMDAKKDGTGITLSVTDNGCGIPEDLLAKITEPFYRVDKARNREHGGAGLGLTLCQKIADVHGAQMTIESAVGTGTIVKITFATA